MKLSKIGIFISIIENKARVLFYKQSGIVLTIVHVHKHNLIRSIVHVFGLVPRSR